MREKILSAFPILVMAAIFCISLPAFATPASVTLEGDPGVWSTIIAFLSNDVVRTILLILGIAGVVIEIATVGSFGVFGVVGVISFVLYFMGNIWAGSMGTASVLLIIGGIVLIIIEIFVIPGFGVAGVAGAVAVLVSLIIAAPNPATAIWSVFIALAVAIGIIWITLKNKKTRKLWSKLILSNRTANKDGYIAADPSLPKYEGAKGIALTTLRPAGSAIFGGDKVDVVTQGEYIDEGSKIEVILIEGTRVVVRSILEISSDNEIVK